ncbi:MAG: hypothetical protein AB1813_14780 [Verrucomicrobiota bacterium]
MKRSNLHSCNVLELRPETRKLWHFRTDDRDVSLASEFAAPSPAPLPPKVVTKDWHALFQKKLNIAWLPANQVFLRVVQLPAADPVELRSMVEFQLEKISPLPVTQIVWSMELLWSANETPEGLKTVVVLIASRSAVEAFLGRLEGEGYFPDRLELPELHQLLVTRVEEDGVWVFPNAENNLCLMAWWTGGALQNLQLVHLPAGEGRSRFLNEQLTTMAWAGEIEGWLTPPTRVHLVADPVTAAEWEPGLRDWSGQPVQMQAPLDKDELARLAARRAVRDESQANLLPGEFATRYKQLFVDRLWMRGVGAAVLVYMAGVLIYLGALEVLKLQQRRVENQVKGVAGSYTNALQLKARIEVLQEQLNLKYAALDCWKITAELLPANLTLNRLNFQNGKLTLQGVAPADQPTLVQDYNQALRKATVRDQPLFSNVNPPKLGSQSQTGGGQMFGWSFDCELNRMDME